MERNPKKTGENRVCQLLAEALLQHAGDSRGYGILTTPLLGRMDFSIIAWCGTSSRSEKPSNLSSDLGKQVEFDVTFTSHRALPIEIPSSCPFLYFNVLTIHLLVEVL